MKFEMANQLKDLAERKRAKKAGEEPDRVIFFIEDRTSNRQHPR
ncbi:UNVERIFIED_ORG: hypothetical protein GCAPEGMB_00476 [Vibrio phage V07]